MMKPLRPFLIFLFVSFPFVLTGFPLAPWVGPNVRLGEDPAALPPGTGKNQAEPHAIRSVVDPDLVLACFQEGRFSDGGARTNGYAISEDGGLTWKRALHPRLGQVNGGPYFRATDPVGGIAIDDTLYLNSLVSVNEGFGIGRLVMQRSDDRGVTWTDPFTIYTGFDDGPGSRIFPDKNWMVVNDYADTPNTGRVIVTWTDFRTLTEGADVQDFLIMSSYSDDRGENWATPVFVTHPGNLLASTQQYQGSQPVFLPGGALAIVYHNFRLNRLEINYSPDGGETFPFDRRGIHDGYILYDAPNMRDGSFLPSVGVARETGDVYVAYTSRESSVSNLGHIYFVRSQRPDSGSVTGEPDWRFSPPVRISGLSPQRVVTTPTIAVSPDGQDVAVYFFDNRFDNSNNFTGDFFAVRSSNGGITWSEPFRLTESTFDLRDSTLTSRGYMIGDYYGFAAPQAPDQAGVAVWVDTRLGTADPWSARVAQDGQAVFDQWIQAHLPYALRLNTLLALPYIDPDLDGTPAIMEYVTGGDPYLSESIPLIANGLEFRVLNDTTDPGIDVEVSPGTGKWPLFRNELSLASNESPTSEGFWNIQTWPGAGQADHFRFSINNEENWFLLDADSPVRWVREDVDGWVWSPWFGWLYTPSAPWLFHLSLGWVYEQGGPLYSASLSSYVYPDVQTHPWIATDSGYIYILDGSPWVFDNTSGTWIQTY